MTSQGNQPQVHDITGTKHKSIRKPYGVLQMYIHNNNNQQDNSLIKSP